MFQRVFNVRESELSGLAEEGMASVRELVGCMRKGFDVQEGDVCRPDGEVWTFRWIEENDSFTVLVDWDRRRGLFRVRDYMLPGAAPIKDWSSMVGMIGCLYDNRLGFAPTYDVWPEDGETESEAVERLEGEAQMWEAELGAQHMEELQVAEYLPIPERVSMHVMKFGSVCL